MCASPDEATRRVRAQAELMESCARVILAALQCDRDHIESAINATHNIAYNLECQPITNESTED